MGHRDNKRRDIMAKQKPILLNQTHGGYFHRDVPKEDVVLTHVGPGTPCGEYLRRYWHPVAFCDEINDLPKSIRILGEDLVLFRDGGGRLGCLELHCSHRGTSLEFGRIEKRGIRCCYHGWQFGVDGKILDTPGEPPDSTYKERLFHGAYPTKESVGMIFVYMGPPDKKPPIPIFDTYDIPGYRLVPHGKDVMPCNWLQMQDNAMDPAHTTFLHSRISTLQFTSAFLALPELDWIETPIGMIYIATRRVGDNIFTRMGEYISPNIGQFPAGPWEHADKEHDFLPAQTTKWRVPIDDVHTLEMTLRRYKNGVKPPPRKKVGSQAGRPWEKRQREPRDYEAQESQRPIAIHGMEHLGATDRGIIMLRRLIRQGIEAVQRGGDPKGMGGGEGGVIRTYGNDTVKRIPMVGTIDQDRRVLRKTGWEWARRYLEDHPNTANGTAYEV